MTMRFLLRGSILCALILSASAAPAQMTGKWGLHAGGNFGRDKLTVRLPIDGNPSDDTTFMGGGSFEGQMAESLALQIEAYYVRRQTTIRFSAGGGLPGIDADYKLNFLDVPVTMKYYFGPEPFLPYIFGGVNFGFRLSVDSENTAAGHTQTFDAADQIKKVNFGLVAGSGIAYRVGAKTFITIDGRYIYGLTNIADSPFGIEEWKTRDLQVMGGVLFGF